MAGRVQWEAQIDSNVARLLSDAKELRNELDGIKKDSNNIKVNIDDKKIGKIISELDEIYNKFRENGKINFPQFDKIANEVNDLKFKFEELSYQLNVIRDYTVDTTNFYNLETQVISLTNRVEKLDTVIKTLNANNTHLGKTDNIIDEKSLNNIIDLFSKIESNLSSMRVVFADVGDGEEFSPLLKMINNVQSSIKELSTSVKGIGLNMNIDVGSDKELESKIQSKISNALQAYQRLFEHIKATSAGGSAINAKFFDFDISQYDTMMGKLSAYKKFIDNMRNEAKVNSNGKDVLFNDTDKKYWTQASSAMGQVTKAFNEMKASASTNPLAELFGKTDLSEVINQLSLIVTKLENISSTASELKTVFANGFNVTTSVEEINKLTSKVKELENELAKVKTTSSASSIKDTFQGGKIEQTTTSARELDRILEGVEIPKEAFNEALAQLDLTKSKLKEIVRITQDWNDGAESFTLKDKYGSTEIYGRSSNTEKGQLLRSHYVQYDAQQAVRESNKAYKELIATIQKYSDIQKRIAKNEAFDGDIALAQKLRDEITELQKQPILSSSQLEEANKRLVKLRLQVEKIKEQTKQSAQSKVDSALDNQLKAWKEIQSIREQIAKTNPEDKNTLDILQREKKEQQEKYLIAEKTLKANIELYDRELQMSKLETIRLKTDKEINKFRIGNINSSIDGFQKKYDDYNSRKEQSAVYRQELEKLDATLKELRATKESVSNKKIVSDEDSEKIKELTKSAQGCVDALSRMSSAEKGSTEGSRLKELDKIAEYMKKNTRMSKEFKAELEALMEILKSGDASVNVGEIHNQFLRIKDRIREARQEGISFLDIFRSKVVYGFAAKLASYYLSFYDFIRYARYAVNTVVELNTEIINLSKVSEQTSTQVYSDFNSYAKIAKEVGATITDTINATTNWAKNGYNIPDSQELAEVALIYKNVGDIDIESANESLISTIRGFKLEAEDAMHVIDVFNNVSNNEAISAGGIGEALKRSAASFDAANTSLEKSVALVTATNSVLQDEEKTGNMWRTVSARIRGAKTELEEAGLETEGMVESTSKLQGLIKGMTGFDILEEDGKTFKDIYDIVLNIGEEFQNLDDIDQAKYNCLYVQKCA